MALRKRNNKRYNGCAMNVVNPIKNNLWKQPRSHSTSSQETKKRPVHPISDFRNNNFGWWLLQFWSHKFDEQFPESSQKYPLMICSTSISKKKPRSTNIIQYSLILLDMNYIISAWWYTLWTISVGMMTFPLDSKTKIMFQTTNQILINRN